MAKGRVVLSDAEIHWHPGFCAAAELGLAGNKEDFGLGKEQTQSYR